MLNFNIFVGGLGADPPRRVGLGSNDREPEALRAGRVQRRDVFRRRRPREVLVRRRQRNFAADLPTNFRRRRERDLRRKKRHIFRRGALLANVVDGDDVFFYVGSFEDDVDVWPVDDRSATFRRLTFRERFDFFFGQLTVPKVDVGDSTRKRVLMISADLESGVCAINLLGTETQWSFTM